MPDLRVTTQAKREVVDITPLVNEFLKDVLPAGGEGEGLVHLFVAHTSAAVTTADLDPGGTAWDYLDAFDQMVPKALLDASGAMRSYRHPHDPEHMPDHILASLIGPSLTLPVLSGELALGQWQRVIFLECDGPRDRRIILTLSGFFTP